MLTNLRQEHIINELMQAIFSLDTVLAQIVALLSMRQFGFNALDGLLLAVIIFYCYEGYLLGFFRATLDFLSFIVSFLLGLVLFAPVSVWLVSIFALPQGFANAIAFFIIALVSEITITLLLRRLDQFAPARPNKSLSKELFKKIDHPLGVLPGLASSYVILSFLLTVIIALPASPLLKQLVIGSRLGSTLVAHTASVQHALSDVFGGAITDTLNVMTVKPQGDATISLNFHVASPTVDEQAEAAMVRLVNSERQRRGLAPLSVDPALLVLARSYGTDMFQKGFFSHYDTEDKSPFDRMNDAGIIYLHAGENLALAPSTQLSHQGLMNSPGHRANILSPQYKKIGIGVMDGGVYGKMYVQEFTD